MMSRNNRSDEYRRNAQGYFSQSQKRDQLLKAEQEKAQLAEREKIARLKSLRLAKEANSDDVNQDGGQN
jgi:hypothetical protein